MLVFISCIIILHYISCQHELLVFHWRLRDNKSPLSSSSKCPNYNQHSLDFHIPQLFQFSVKVPVFFQFLLIFPCWNFVKELVILFHRTAAAPWGHVASIIKRSSIEDSSSIFSTPTAVSNRSIRSSPWRYMYLVPSTSRDPRATNARADLKGTGYTDS